MAENNDEPTGADDTVVGDPAPTPQPTPAAAGPRFTDRVWSFRAVLAVALASLILGGGIGSAIAAVSSSDDDGTLRMSRYSDGPGERGRHLPGMPGLRMHEPPGQRGDVREFREKMREQLKEMRKDFREQRKELREEGRDARPGDEPEVTPTDPASPGTTG